MYLAVPRPHKMMPSECERGADGSSHTDRLMLLLIHRMMKWEKDESIPTKTKVTLVARAHFFTFLKLKKAKKKKNMSSNSPSWSSIFPSSSSSSSSSSSPSPSPSPTAWPSHFFFSYFLSSDSMSRLASAAM